MSDLTPSLRKLGRERSDSGLRAILIDKRRASPDVVGMKCPAFQVAIPAFGRHQSSVFVSILFLSSCANISKRGFQKRGVLFG